MKKLLLLLTTLVMALLFTGCETDAAQEERTSDGTGLTIHCIQGKQFIKYYGYEGYMGYYGLSINLDFQGKPIPCTSPKVTNDKSLS